ncbi:IS5 family transposase [Planctomicrobium sp. SH527]|uniref:IS5 family transposase n=1 Tax=Planctomicrobium sp. SH527 TaxID=3448123 RepID=UPI003F5CB3F4
MHPGNAAFDATTFTKNRQRLEEHGLTRAFFDAVVFDALTKGLCSEHFSVDGTLIESLASAKSFRPKEAERQDSNNFKPRNPEIDFHGQKRSNQKHASQTDPEARLYSKSSGQEAKLSHMGHVLSENRHGLILGITATQASGTAERQATEELLHTLQQTHGLIPTTLGADKGYDDGTFFQSLEERGIVPHIPLVKPPVDVQTVREAKRIPGIQARRGMKERMEQEAYRLSQRCRKKVEECFCWLKGIAGLDRCRTVGRWKLRQQLELGPLRTT